MADLARIKNEFLTIYQALSQASQASLLEGKEAALYPCFEKLDRMAAMKIDDAEAEQLRRDRELEPVLAHICGMKRANGLRMEIANANTVLKARAPWDVVKHYVYYPNYLELARMEATGGKLVPGDRVAFLGSGPIPLTLICLCTRYKIRGIGIERCAEYADLSRQLIEALELTGRIQIIEADHHILPLEETCQLTMIGADAMPKDEIFSLLAGRLEDGTRLSYRIYEKGLRRLLDVQSDFTLPSEFKEVGRIRPVPPVNNTSVFVEKQGGG